MPVLFIKFVAVNIRDAITKKKKWKISRIHIQTCSLKGFLNDWSEERTQLSNSSFRQKYWTKTRQMTSCGQNDC